MLKLSTRTHARTHTRTRARTRGTALSLTLQIKEWSELDKLAALPELREVLFIGNPIYDGIDRKEAKLQVLKRLPRLAKVDNEMVIDAERELAAKL